MSTYRKFDKYRQRADFLSDMEFGIDTPSNKWISSGTGTPAVAVVDGGGLTVATSSGGTDASFIQRGIISAATKREPLILTKGRKAHIVAAISDAGGDDLGFGFMLGFAAAATTPLTEADRAILHYDPEVGFTAELGASKSVTLEAHVGDFMRDGQLALEVYYDGTDKVQFYAGRTRIAALDAAFNEATGISTDVSGAMSPTFGVMNLGVAAVHTAHVHALGYAIQRVPNYT